MDQDMIDQAAEEIAVQAAVGPGTTPGSKVANTLSPHFKHYTAERIRQALRESGVKQLDTLAEIFRELEAAMLTEDNKLGSAVAPETPNADAVRAIAADCAQTRVQLIEGALIRLRAMLRSTIV